MYDGDGGEPQTFPERQRRPRSRGLTALHDDSRTAARGPARR